MAFFTGICTSKELAEFLIPFFKKIRIKLADYNKPLKYMRYATGEIVRGDWHIDIRTHVFWILHQ